MFICRNVRLLIWAPATIKSIVVYIWKLNSETISVSNIGKFMSSIIWKQNTIQIRTINKSHIWDKYMLP
jgi:hypothetical protein